MTSLIRLPSKAAFNTWLADVLTQAAVDGGCNPQVANDAANVTVPDLCAGGTATVTWTITDLCESPSFNAAFIVTPPEPVTFTEPQDITVNACDFADQAALNAAFNTWLADVLSQASVAGGCDPQVANDAASITVPDLCAGGTATVTWSVIDLCESPSFNAAFIVTPPEPVTFTEPQDITVNACDYADQAALNSAFNTWLADVLSQAAVAGGCDPQVANDAASITVPDLCAGGTATVTWSVTDLCESPTFNAAFIVTPPEPVTFTEPQDLTVNACDFADQAALNAAFNTWLADVLTQAAVAGGCDPQVANDAASITVPDLCAGGTATVTWTVTDRCESPSFNAAFIVTPPEPVTFTEPQDLTVNACDFADQAALQAAFITWLRRVPHQAALPGVVTLR